MKKNLVIGLGLALAFSVFAEEQKVTDVSAAKTDTNVKVTWENPEDYTDVKAANESRKKFRERTLNRFEEHFAKLAETLPEGHTLDITVTDVDLAGMVWPQQFIGIGHGAGDVRLIKNIDIPRMEFSYTLKNKGALVKEAEVSLKDMGFLDRSIRGFDSDPLRYEKRMLDQWFRKEFTEQTAKN